MANQVEFVGGPKDGEVWMLQEELKEIRLPVAPVWKPPVDPGLREDLAPSEIVYRKRELYPRHSLAGARFYDYEP